MTTCQIGARVYVKIEFGTGSRFPKDQCVIQVCLKGGAVDLLIAANTLTLEIILTHRRVSFVTSRVPFKTRMQVKFFWA